MQGGQKEKCQSMSGSGRVLSQTAVALATRKLKFATPKRAAPLGRHDNRQVICCLALDHTMSSLRFGWALPPRIDSSEGATRRAEMLSPARISAKQSMQQQSQQAQQSQQSQQQQTVAAQWQCPMRVVHAGGETPPGRPGYGTPAEIDRGSCSAPARIWQESGSSAW